MLLLINKLYLSKSSYCIINKYTQSIQIIIIITIKSTNFEAEWPSLVVFMVYYSGYYSCIKM